MKIKIDSEIGADCIRGDHQGSQMASGLAGARVSGKFWKTIEAAIWYGPFGTTAAKMMQVKRLPAEQKKCLWTVLGVYKSTPVLVLKAEYSIPSTSDGLSGAQLNSLTGYSLNNEDSQRMDQKKCREN